MKKQLLWLDVFEGKFHLQIVSLGSILVCNFKITFLLYASLSGKKAQIFKELQMQVQMSGLKDTLCKNNFDDGGAVVVAIRALDVALAAGRAPTADVVADGSLACV